MHLRQLTFNSWILSLYFAAASAPVTRCLRSASRFVGRTLSSQPAPYGSLFASRMLAAKPSSLVWTISHENGAGNGPTHFALSIVASGFHCATFLPTSRKLTAANFPQRVCATSV